MRYAADAQRVALRERFDAEGRVVSTPALELVLVELTGSVRVLDLRTDRTLDALGLDDQVSTSRAPGVWAACHALTDRVVDWFGQRCAGLVYRPRTTPERAANLVLFPWAPLAPTALGRLGDRVDLLAACVAADGFTVDGAF